MLKIIMLITIVLYFLGFRAMVKLCPEVLEDMPFLVFCLLLFVGLIPFLNTLIEVILLCTLIHDLVEVDVIGLAKKIFFIKDKNKDE